MIAAIGSLALTLTLAMAAGADEPAGAKPDPSPEPAPKIGVQALALPGQDPAEPFVPLHPRTAEDQSRIDALDDYVSARALEDQRRNREAIDLLERALEKDPDSLAITRRLARLCFSMGRIRQGVDYARRVVKADPADSSTLGQLIEHYRARRDAATLEGLLDAALADPKLDKGAPATLLARKALGDLYAEARPPQFAKAADAYARVVEGLDDRAAARFSPADQKRILGEEAESYERFGDVFFVAKRFDLAIRAYRRGLAYDPDHADLPRKLAQAQLKAGRAAEALATLEPFLKGKPEGQEAYLLLAQALTALKRPGEILPRLEDLARADTKNIPLQYALAERLKEAGQDEKARALVEEIQRRQPDPQGLAAQAAALRKQKKNAELLKLFEKALAPDQRAASTPALMPQLEAIALDPAYTEELLDEGLKLQVADPPGLGKEGRLALVFLATKAKKLPKFIPIARAAAKRDPGFETFKELADALDQAGQTGEAADEWAAMLEKFPEQKTPENYGTLVDFQFKAGKAAEAAAAIEAMLEKFPDRRVPQVLVSLGYARLQAGQYDAAMKAARDALALDADDVNAQNFVGIVLGRQNRNDEAIAHYKGMLERYPNDDERAKKAHQGLSTIYVNMDELDKGEAELELLLQKDPDDEGTNNDLGYLYADRGKHLEQAEAMVRKALEERPDNPAYLDSLGWVLFKRGKVQEAVEPLEKAAKSNLPDATIYDHLGDVYFRLQEHAKAKASWERAESTAARTSPPDKRLPEIRKKLESLGKVAPAPRAASGESP